MFITVYSALLNTQDIGVTLKLLYWSTVDIESHTERGSNRSHTGGPVIKKTNHFKTTSIGATTLRKTYRQHLVCELIPK